MDKYKTCSVCKVAQNQIHFYRNNSAADGLRKECKSCFNQIRKKSYLKHRDKVSAYGYAYRAKNRVAIKQMQRQLDKDQPERRRLSLQLRRAKQVGASIYFVSHRQIAKLLREPCAYCGSKAVELDHVIPLSRNGVHSIGNMVASCRSCNRSKGNKYITEWKKVRGW